MKGIIRYFVAGLKILFFVVIFSGLLNLSNSGTMPTAVAVVDSTVTIPDAGDDTPFDHSPIPENNNIDNPTEPQNDDSPATETNGPTDTEGQAVTPADNGNNETDNDDQSPSSEEVTPVATPQPKAEDTPVEHKPSYDQVEFNNIVLGSSEKTAYLTFDDGPTPKITRQVLDILRDEGIKATFFMIGSYAKSHPYLVKQVYDEGHGIGNHTYSHDFSYIYSDKQKFMKDIKKCEDVLKSILGEDKQFNVARFPGGSFGTKLIPYRNLLNESGYVYVDWNCINGDAETVERKTREELIEKVKSTVRGQTNLIVLMHDAYNKNTTVDALPEIIQYLKSLGYKFELLPWTR